MGRGELSAHTPGPWRANGLQIEAPVGLQGWHATVAVCDEEGEGDALLMAAAPELLEACKTIISAYENADVVPNALDAAYAAVNKAEGRP